MLAAGLLPSKPIWSNMAISSKKCEAILWHGGQPFLENLAVAARRAPVASGRHAGCAMKAAHEVRQIREAGVERHARDSAVLVRQQLSGPAQTPSDQILVRRDPHRRCEDPTVLTRRHP